MEAQVHFHGQLWLFRQRMSDEGPWWGSKNPISDLRLESYDAGQDSQTGRHLMTVGF